ncbi:MAG: RNA methyltransferase [Desulfobulbaceae bacterium A2]|nr:MAG: RNA methyltransferase [Desulfobulbaceae bacterium A2]
MRRPGAPRPASVLLRLFATVPLGAEELAAAELTELGARDIAVVRGGVVFRGERALLYRALLCLRTVSRVLLQLGRFSCQGPEELYDGVRALPWPELLTPDMTLAVDCNLRDAALTHGHYAALKAKDAIVDRLRDDCGRRPSVDTRAPDLRVNLHLVGSECTVSLDASGAPLDRRGWRQDRTAAPLRETLAAAVMLLSGWDGTVPLLDPMCGAGTLLLEGAAIALRRPAGAGRSFGLERWRDFDNRLWRKVLREVTAAGQEYLDVPILGRDRDPAALAACRNNARRAGLEQVVQWERGRFEDVIPPGPAGVIVLNPPYGIRLGEKEGLRPLYRRIGELCKERFGGWTLYILAGDRELVHEIGLRPARRHVLFNGPIECRLLRYELY